MIRVLDILKMGIGGWSCDRVGGMKGGKEFREDVIGDNVVKEVRGVVVEV